ncbi:MAG: biopolymer transporter ExbD [Gammaproteobacteria bacterium]|nr:biopolymer transporter ExbD [Gammaproteobacteria bacterium]
MSRLLGWMHARGTAVNARHRRRDSTTRRGEGNMVPLINVVFLLLLYFVITGNLAARREQTITAPLSASTAVPPQQAPTLHMTADGSLRYEGRALAIEAVPLALESLPVAARHEIRVEADAATDAANVAMLLDALARAGAGEVVLVTTQRRDAGVDRR